MTVVITSKDLAYTIVLVVAFLICSKRSIPAATPSVTGIIALTIPLI